MLVLFWLGFWTGLTVLMFAAGVSLRVRLKESIGRATPLVDDDDVDQILRTGVLITHEDQPLDLEEIDDEERKFWSEPWDQPEEW
ncbi:MAG: hypothetical protein O2992_04085 [Gemmatimonadetes bacterium]|nr:hypothetical protein [Gemmatimonadota bacterium]